MPARSAAPRGQHRRRLRRGLGGTGDGMRLRGCPPGRDTSAGRAGPRPCPGCRCRGHRPDGARRTVAANGSPNAPRARRGIRGPDPPHVFNFRDTHPPVTWAFQPRLRPWHRNGVSAPRAATGATRASRPGQRARIPGRAWRTVRQSHRSPDAPQPSATNRPEVQGLTRFLPAAVGMLPQARMPGRKRSTGHALLGDVPACGECASGFDHCPAAAGQGRPVGLLVQDEPARPGQPRSSTRPAP